MKAKRRSWLWAAAVPFVFALALESGARLFVKLDALVYQDSLEPGLGFELKPGARGTKADVWVEINAQGLRERDLPFEKPADEFRVVVVGDHPTFGLGVPIEQAYARLLESTLRPIGGRRIRTVNLSMYSYTLPQKVELLRVRGMRYQPDFVVFQVTPRDIRALPRVLYHDARVKNWIRSHCYSCRWVSERLFWRRAPPPPTHEGPPAIPTELAELQAILSQRAKIPLLVVLCPDLSAQGGDAAADDAVAREYRDVSRKLGIDFKDLSGELRQRQASEMLKNVHDPWLSPAAHELAAQAVAREVQRVLRRRGAAQRPRV